MTHRAPLLPGDPFAGGLRPRLAVAALAVVAIWALVAFGVG